MTNAGVATPEKPNLLFLIAINTLAAMCTQTFFLVSLYGLLYEIPKKLTSDATYELAVTALLITCAFTAIVTIASTYLFEKSPFFDENRMQDQEISRATYFSVVGMMGVCITKAIEADRILPAAILLVVISLLLVLGRYHLKFREARQGIWFPHTIFQYAIQQFALFPAGLWIISKILNRS